MRIGLDTNILVYMLDNTDEKKHEKALEILVNILASPGDYAVSPQVLAEFLYVVKRKQPAAEGDALLLAERLKAKGVVTGSYGVDEVLGAAKHPAGRFWDALIAYTYLSHGVKVILTENTEDFKNLMDAVNPFEEKR